MGLIIQIALGIVLAVVILSVIRKAWFWKMLAFFAIVAFLIGIALIFIAVNNSAFGPGPREILRTILFWIGLLFLLSLFSWNLMQTKKRWVNFGQSPAIKQKIVNLMKAEVIMAVVGAASYGFAASSSNGGIFWHEVGWGCLGAGIFLLFIIPLTINSQGIDSEGKSKQDW